MSPKLFELFVLDILHEEILIFIDKFTYLEGFDITCDFDLVDMERKVDPFVLITEIVAITWKCFGLMNCILGAFLNDLILKLVYFKFKVKTIVL